MFGANSKVEDNTQKVVQAERKAAFENIRHAAFSIGKLAKKSIKKRKGPSAVGEPPHTRGRGRKNIRGAIFTAATKDSALIGPRHSYVGESGRAHELGEVYEGEKFDERPFMGPALEESTPRFAQGWQGSIGE